MEETASGRTTSVSDAHSRNASYPIVVIVSGSVGAANCVQPANVRFPMVSALEPFANVTVFNAVQPSSI